MTFQKALPIWAKGEEKTKNYRLYVKTMVADLKGGSIRVTANNFYALTVNGVFIAFGPARTAKGYARVDEIDLDAYAKDGENEIVIETAGYYNRGLATVLQPSYLVAEIVNADGGVLAYTGKDFIAYKDVRRVQKTERYSYQRHFGEVFDERQTVCREENRVELAVSDLSIRYLSRVAPYPSYEEKTLAMAEGVGTFRYDETLPCKKNRYSHDISERWGKYEESEIEYFPYRWVQKQAMERFYSDAELPLSLSEGEYAVFDLKKMETGFLRWAFSAAAESEVTFAFSEARFHGEFTFPDGNMQNVVHVIAPNGYNGKGQSFEPYVFRYLAVYVKRGEISLSSVGVLTYEHTKKGIREHAFKDERLAAIYKAAVNTFAHNAVDIYTDCPSRERAGWLCDSFFTARAEYYLFGESKVESAFLENFAFYKNEGELPDGVLPMCYPADLEDWGAFIPQWAMWYVIETYEYLTLRNPSADKEKFRESIFGMIGFLRRHENEDGLLEKLPSWNFVEWSKANTWTQDVNYPTNFLYAKVLESAGTLYNVSEWLDRAKAVRERTKALSFDGELFVDHAVRNEEGKLVNLTDTSEAGQYYALLFGDIDWTEERYAKLRDYVLNGFDGVEKDREFCEVNAFIGFYMRLIFLMEKGERAVMKRDILRFFGHMEEQTGTLWEYKDGHGSRDHGFASLAAMAAVMADEA